MKPSNVQELEQWCSENDLKMDDDKEAMLKEFWKVDVYKLLNMETGSTVEFNGDGFEATEELFRLNPSFHGVRIKIEKLT